jgi:hypothetical protein
LDVRLFARRFISPLQLPASALTVYQIGFAVVFLSMAIRLDGIDAYAADPAQPKWSGLRDADLRMRQMWRNKNLGNEKPRRVTGCYMSATTRVMRGVFGNQWLSVPMSR